MNKVVYLTAILLCMSMFFTSNETKAGEHEMASMHRRTASPNGKLVLTMQDDGLTLGYEGRTALRLPARGMNGTKLGKPKFVKRVKADYTMLSGKRSHCTNEGNEYSLALGTEGTALIVRLYNDGMAFRYEGAMPPPSAKEEALAYRIPEGTRRWMQRWTDSYEGFFPLSTTAGEEGRWGYPALTEPADGLFALITEANIERGQSASCLYSQGDVFRVVPDEQEERTTGAWHTPWRVVIVGSLATVVESTLVTDVSEPCALTDTDWIHPGVVSWVYWAYNHGSNDCNIIGKYVDMAATLGLPYVLIDAEWDEMKDGKTIEDAVNYAHAKGVKPLIWYNSSVGWVNGAPGPKFRLNKAEDREKEFAWCERIGVAGVKIDFFSGDNQMNMDYCHDLMESAARHHLLVNFHGATIPRGWQRTYPNLLSTEGVYGAEWYNNVPTFTKRAAQHNATLPFTRNVIGPMDYTPCAFSNSQHPHITSNAHELALTVLFESGLQHLADKPESFLAQPKEVQSFLSHLPASWDETRFVSGYPGEFAVLARRKGNTWYVAGINGTDSDKSIPLPLSKIVGNKGWTYDLFEDSGNANEKWQISTSVTGKPLPSSIDCQPRGGFVLVINN